MPESVHRPLVAWIVRRIETTFNLGILQGIQKGVREAGFGLLLDQSGDTHVEESSAIRNVVAAGASGDHAVPSGRREL